MTTFECHCEEGQVHQYEARKMVRYVCPQNGTLVWCDECQCAQPHKCEVLATEGRIVSCFTHDTPLGVAP
jgi:hypothetical protein